MKSPFGHCSFQKSTFFISMFWFHHLIWQDLVVLDSELFFLGPSKNQGETSKMQRMETRDKGDFQRKNRDIMISIRIKRWSLTFPTFPPSCPVHVQVITLKILNLWAGGIYPQALPGKNGWSVFKNPITDAMGLVYYLPTWMAQIYGKSVGKFS